MQSNFDFLKDEWNFLYNSAREAEKNAITAPVTSAFYSRLTLEKMVDWLYENEGYLNQPYNTNLAARMGEQTFREIIPPSIYQNIDYIRREGNIAAHQGKTSHKVSVPCVRFLFRFLSWTAKMYSEHPPEISRFDESFMPKIGSYEKTKTELERLEKKNKEQIGVTNRAYQKLAIKSVLGKFIKDTPSEIKGGSRKSLIVMATGTGKTRTSHFICRCAF